MPGPGRIHNSAEQYYFARFPDDRKYVSSFLHWFDCNHAGRLTAAPKSPAIFYLRPLSAEISRFLGIADDKEILFVFSPFERFETRELKALDRAFEDEPLRLDPRILLVGSRDPNTGERVRKYVLEDVERTPVIGFSLDELNSIATGDDLYRIVRQRHFIRDYFSLESALNEAPMFFGRHELLSEITNRVAAGQNTGVFGLRRIGKTSILFAVRRRCASTKSAFAFYKDMSPTYNLRWWEVLELLIRELSHGMTLSSGNRKKIVAVATGYSEADAAHNFGADAGILGGTSPPWSAGHDARRDSVHHLRCEPRRALEKRLSGHVDHHEISPSEFLKDASRTLSPASIHTLLNTIKSATLIIPYFQRLDPSMSAHWSTQTAPR